MFRIFCSLLLLLFLLALLLLLPTASFAVWMQAKQIQGLVAFFYAFRKSVVAAAAAAAAALSFTVLMQAELFDKFKVSSVYILLLLQLPV